MDKIHKEISRRNLFRYLGNSVVFLPFMRTMLETQAFGEVSAKRACFFYYPDGIIPVQFHPGATGSTFTLPAMTSPLAAIQGDIIMIKNLWYNATDSHQGGARHGLTGYSGQAKNPSIESIIGNHFKGQIPALRLGVASSYEGGAAKQVSYDMEGNFPQFDENPTVAFNTIFGGQTSPSPNTGNPTKPTNPKGLTNNLKKSLLDANLEEIKSLQTKLGSIEKSKLNSHIEAVRELERRIQASNTGGGSGGSTMGCTKMVNQPKTFPANGGGEYPKDIHKSGNFDVVTDMMIDIAVQAMACGATQSVFIQLSHSVSNIKFANGMPSDVGSDHHDASHYGGLTSENAQKHIANQKYMMGKFVRLVKGMAAIKEGDQSMLYNSVCMAFSELGDSDAHSFDQVGTVLAGQGGGYFKTGRCVDAQDKSQANVLTSIVQSMGINAPHIGSTEFANPNFAKKLGDKAAMPMGPLAVLRG